jgi:thiol-disulfide isomerase/thioredoxin
MKFYLIIPMLVMALQNSAQHNISGTFSPEADYTWLIAYRLEPAAQAYIADTQITNGRFSLHLPENSRSGTYRLVYGVPQEEYYFDVLYSGKEDIELAFDKTDGVSFINSVENKIYRNYFRDITRHEQKIISFYNSGSADTGKFESLVAELRRIQKTYEDTSRGLLAQEFIVANAPYLPSRYEAIQDYLSNKKDHYFKGLDMSNPILQASDFLTNKMVNYVFTVLPPGPTDQAPSEEVRRENVLKVDRLLQAVDKHYKLKVYEALWTEAVAGSYEHTSDFIYDSYLKPLAAASGNQEMIQKIEISNRLRIGAPAPEISWTSGDDLKKLTALEAAQNYVLVFWSSTCSHCLSELPKLHAALKEKTDIKVLAIGLEDDQVTWQQESAKLPAFEHAISLGKWESEYSITYAIQKTPTYFILDSNKKIVATPEDYEGLLGFLDVKRDH